MTADPRVLELEGQVTELQRQLRLLQTDAVTGIPVRRVFERELRKTFILGLGTLRDSDRFGILMIDIDHFKRFNDERGHLEGDTALRRVARIIQEHVRPDDLLARYGGEEFVVIVPRADRKSVIRLAERVRTAVDLDYYPLTVSVGYSLRLPGDGSEWAVVERADAALYQAKDAGRNCVQGNI
jgi:diguanylate cyclase (GGDEF)-like protein